MKRSYDVNDCIKFVVESFFLGMATFGSGVCLLVYFFIDHDKNTLFMGITLGIAVIFLLILIISAFNKEMKNDNQKGNPEN